MGIGFKNRTPYPDWLYVLTTSVMNYMNTSGNISNFSTSGTLVDNCKCSVEYTNNTLKLYINNVLINTVSVSNPYSSLGLPLVRINGGNNGHVKYVMIETL